MCRLPGVSLLLVAVVALGTSAAAQDRADAERRLEVFAGAARAAAARVAAYDDSLARARRRFESVVVHPFRVRVEPELAHLVRPAAAAAVRELAWAGPAIERLAAREFVLRRDRSPWRTGDEVYAIAAVVDSAGVERWPVVGRIDTAGTVAGWLTHVAKQVLAADVPRDVRRWLGVEPVLDSVPALAWARLRLDLVSSPSSLARACYAGDPAACPRMLGLTPTTDPVREWFDADARRALVRRTWTRYGRTPQGIDAECIAGSDAACITVLRGSSFENTIFATGHRMALLQLAIQLGGTGALARLYEADGSLAQRLERVAGVPADSLVRAWRARIRETRLPSEDLTPAIGAMSLAWVGLFAGLALRNSRWR